MKFDNYKDDVIEGVKRLVNIESVIDNMTKSIETPFGKNIDLCLDETLKLCEELGMKTYKDLNGFYGYAEIGEGPEYIGIMCHLDVVPAGDLSLWDTNPFEATVIGEEIYGRGTGDDKGPTISAIYAVKAIADSGIQLKKRIRLIFGTDEETLWRGIDYYKECEQDPMCAIAADGYFPFTYAEKGLLQLNLISENKDGYIRFNGGQNYNSVADTCVYDGPLIKKIIPYIESSDFSYTLEKDKLTIIGSPSHASRPHDGKNAVLLLADILNKLGQNQPHINVLSEVFNVNHDDMKVFKNPIVDQTGEITINIGAINMDEDILIKLDLRIPVTYDKETIEKEIENRVKPYGFKKEFRSYLNPLYVPLDSPFTKILLESYQNVSKDYISQPRINGGATFARAYPDRAVCYGVKVEGKPSFAHEPNERIDIPSLMNGIEVYFEALKRLNELEKI